MMNLWEFLYPLVGDVRGPVSMAYAAGVLVYLLTFTRCRWYNALVAAGILTMILQYIPGTTLFLTAAVTGLWLFVWLVVHTGEEEQVRFMRGGTLQYPVEYLDNGLIAGYKWLVRYKGRYYSPETWDEWVGGRLVSDVTPAANNTNGVYFCYTPDADELRPYQAANRVKVRIAVKGRTVLHEYAGRAREARILSIVEPSRIEGR